VSPSHWFRRVWLGGLTLTACAALAAFALLTGCAQSGGSAGQSQNPAHSAPATQSAPPAVSTNLPLDVQASQGERPVRTTPSVFSSTWFPPTDTDGLTELANAKERTNLIGWAEANPGFWIAPSGLSEQPYVSGADALGIARRSGFGSALVVDVRRLKPELPARPSAIASSIESKTSSYQVLLTGKAGITSFGIAATGTAGSWALDSQGELVNWSTALDAVSRQKGFTPVDAYVVRTVYDLGGRPALYVSWAVFSDGGGREFAATLHAPPRISATWKLGGQPFGLGIAYPATALFGPITVTPLPTNSTGSTMTSSLP
jgi:hypothetical protein